MKDLKKFILENSSDLEDMTQDLSEWWDEYINADGYDNNKAFRQDMEAMTDEANDSLVDMALDALVNDYDWSEHEVEKQREDLIIVMKQWAEDELENL